MSRLVPRIAPSWAAIAIVLLLTCIRANVFAAGQVNDRKVRRVTMSVAAAVSRDQNQMRKDAQTYAKPGPEIELHNHLTIPLEKYRALKAAARSMKRTPRSLPSAVPLATGGGVVLDASLNFDGTDQHYAAAHPPDTHGAAGNTQYVEVTNHAIDIYDKASGALLFESGLAAFYGNTSFTADSRVLHDPIWDRWVVISISYAFPPDFVQPMFVAVSKTGDATGPYWIYNIEVSALDNNAFLDFPQLGMDQDSIIITGNPLSANFAGAELFTIAKARLYNGMEFSIARFSGLQATLAPPIVSDQNPNTYLIAATPENNVLYLYALTDSSRPSAADVTGPFEVPVAPYTIPPNAPQPSPCGDAPRNLVETFDARFTNASTQVGRFLYQTHTINVSGLATPKFYKIDTSTHTLVDSGIFFARASTSNDFNASIAADADNNIYVTWTSIDTSLNRNADVRFAGKRASAPVGSLGNGIPVFTSSTCITNSFDGAFGQRWGDYSSVAVDPQGNAWFVNEKVIDGGFWGSRIGRLRFKQVPP
jgi:hypothetical protein